MKKMKNELIRRNKIEETYKKKKEKDKYTKIHRNLRHTGDLLAFTDIREERVT
jgi:hypothetical protein